MNYSLNLKLTKIGLAIFAVSLSLFSSSSFAIPAFPGAEGYGAESVGGRGGNVIKVTTLNDAGSGSLRAALTASGPRIVVFEVSGIINLSSDITIRNPYITIAGQTSPGGVLVAGRHIKIETHNVIMRYMRLRPGSHMGDPNSTHALEILGPTYAQGEGAHTVIIDHCSLGWGIDETLGVTGGVLDATISWSIVGEGLNNAGHDEPDHSKAFFVSTRESSNPTRVSMHHNYIPLSFDRVPLIQNRGGSIDTMKLDGRNNVTYGWKGGLSPQMNPYSQVDWVHNYARQGPASHPWAYEFAIEVGGRSASPMLFYEGNIGSTRMSQNDPQWNVGDFYFNSLASSEFQRNNSWGHPSVTTTPMSDSYADTILDTVGANKPFRDSADAEVVAHFRNGTGTVPEDVDFPGDFPTFQNIPAQQDNDGDGMPDNWENANELNASADDSASDADNDGYTNIEEYLHFLADDLMIVRPAPPSNLGTDSD